MKRCSIVSAIALSAALAATATLAAPVVTTGNQGEFFVGVNGGVGILGGDFLTKDEKVSDYFNTGFDFGVTGGYWMTHNVSLEEAFKYVSNSPKDVNTDNTVVRLLFMTNLKYHFDIAGFSPYVGVGVGLQHMYATDDGKSVDASSNSFAYQGVAGVDYDLGNGLALGVNYHILSTAAVVNFNSGNVVKTPITNLINASVTYTF